MMIHARIRGESAPARRNQRRIGNVSNPAQEESPVPQSQAPWCVCCAVTSIEYQGSRNKLMRNRIAPAPPSSVRLRSSLEKSIAATLTQLHEPRDSSYG